MDDIGRPASYGLVVADTPAHLPSFVSWPSFPFDGQLHVKRLDPPVAVEPPREGEDPATCTACHAPDAAYIWVSDRWRVRAMDRPSGLPMVLILESRSHLDLGDLTNLLAAELGVMTVRLERAIRSLESVERVHVNRWGDGAAHLHVWFLARPTGQLQLRGSFLSLWDEILEPISETRWREHIAHVAAWLADFGGRAVAEPPRIEWHTPSSFGEASAYAIEEPIEAPAETTTEAKNGTHANASAPQDARSVNGRTAEASQNGAASANGTSVTAKPAEETSSNGDGGQAKPGADAEDGELDGEGWTLSGEEVAASDILSR
jgi:hypothetical protein